MALRVDDWMRVTRGAWPLGSRPAPTSADRRASLVVLVACVLVVAVAAVWGGWRGVGVVGGFLAMGVGSAVRVVRLRHLGWGR